MTLTFGSLFAGIGGIDLGLERAGMQCRWQVEIDPFCRQVLDAHWPDVPKYGDIKELSGDDLERVDVVAGGFPCQPVSHAGKRQAQTDSRWLWPYFARIIRVVRPRFVVVENVPGLLDPWLDEGGGWMPAPIEEVLADMETCGFYAEWDCIPAAAVGAHHLRDRVFIVAHAHGDTIRSAEKSECWCSDASLFADDGANRIVADAESVVEREPAAEGDTVASERKARQVVGSGGQCRGTEDVAHAALDDGQGEGTAQHQSRTTEQRESGRGGGRVGLFGQWLPEPSLGRVAHGVSHRVVEPQLRALGNAVVPQVAEWVGRRIMAVSA